MPRAVQALLEEDMSCGANLSPRHGWRQGQPSPGCTRATPGQPADVRVRAGDGYFKPLGDLLHSVMWQRLTDRASCGKREKP